MFPDLNYIFYTDSLHWILGAGGLILLILYYLISWKRISKIPEKSVIISRYEPPEGFSPSVLHYVEKMKYDMTCFAAALISMAVKGHIKIIETDGVYTLVHTDKTVKLEAGEAALDKRLFGDEKTRILNQQSHGYINAAENAHAASLRNSYEFKYFVRNSRYFIPGVTLTTALLFITILAMPASSFVGASLFFLIWLSLWSSVVFGLVYAAVKSWQSVNRRYYLTNAVKATVNALIFSAPVYIIVNAFFEQNDWFLIGLAITGAGINWLFYELLKASALSGRELLNKVEGFRHYLDVAEKQELANRHPPGRTPELFERYLPYALALGVEQQWAEKFTDILTRVSAVGKTAYHPVWYSGAAWDDNHIGGFSASLGSQFTGSIVASSSLPGT